MNRQRLILAILLGVLVLSIIYALRATPRQEQAPPRSATRSPAKAVPAGKGAPPVSDRLHLGLLAEMPQPFPGARRDIFRFRGGPVMPVVVAPPSAPPVAEEVPPPPPPSAQEILQQQVGKFTFLGFLEKGQARTVFLSSGGALYLVKAGDSFGRQRELIARDITASELVVGSSTGTETVRVKLIEKQALKPEFLLPGGAGTSLQQKGLPSGLRQESTGFQGRRLMPQRRLFPSPTVLPAETDVEQELPEDEQPPPDDGENQEEPPAEGPSGGEGDGDKE